MFSTFDVLIESSLSETSAKEFITVGWGKKETQFHGSVGKDARKKQEIEVGNDDGLDKTISCCWRGDGEFFAVNYVGNNGRMFKVFNKEGTPQYTSEICANLQVPMAWKPSGLWIAKPEILPNKYSITLFERNGLKHNELVLPFKADEEQVMNISWSQDSDIFLIETRRTNICRLYFYTISNYHWYMKHTMEFEDSVVYTWSQNYADPKQLHLFTSQGEFKTLKFEFLVNHSNGKSDTDETIVAVVDGQKLLLTNFKSQMMPPPMASLEVPLVTPVNIVEFLQQPNENFDSNAFLTLDGLCQIKLYRCVFGAAVNGKRLTGVEVAKEISLKGCGTFTNALWIDSSHIVLINESTIHLCSIDLGSIVHETQLENVIGNIALSSTGDIIAQLVDGTLVGFKVESDELHLLDLDLKKLPEFCEKFIATTNNGAPAVYALKSMKKKLYLNSKEIATEVTSFTITSDNAFLIYTTIGELKFMAIEKASQDVVESRRIERGSRIVSLVKDKSQIIFQLPRGNLETISPRILSFKIIKRHLEHMEYRLALDLLRKERINLNLLIDLNPQKFLKELKIFIEQIDNTQWLNLFLTELKNEDVTVTMYKFCESIKSEEVFDATFKIDSKISFLCNKMLQIFQEMCPRKFLLPSITCYVKNQQIESALQLIWDLKKSGSGDKEADDALKFLLYLIDVNVLYNIALGMYDYQLVLFVAQKSQKDPKEYVPFLNKLNKLEPSYAKFKIDSHLKRYSKAIKHIAELCCNDEAKFEECVELTKKHQLFEVAMEAFVGNASCYQRICVLFGDNLRTRGKLLDASLLYERGGEYQQALSGARNILDWQRCMVLARKSGFNDDEMKDLAMKLCASLKESGKFKEASELVRKFVPNDIVELVEVLSKGRLYSDAIFEACTSGHDELIENVIKPQLKVHLEEATKVLDNDRQLYLDQKDRLLVVRREKVRKLENPQDNDDDMFSDTTSLASTTNSRNTAKTFKTSKTKRKHERKLLNLKEGNRFEDVALIDSIWKLVHKIISHENQNLMKELLKSAIELNLDEEGKILQKTFKDLLLLLKNSMDEIWVPEMLSAGKYPENEEEMLQYNLDPSMVNKLSFELISKSNTIGRTSPVTKLIQFFNFSLEPDQRFKPKMNIIEFEMELFKDTSKKPQE